MDISKTVFNTKVPSAAFSKYLLAHIWFFLGVNTDEMLVKPLLEGKSLAACFTSERFFRVGCVGCQNVDLELVVVQIIRGTVWANDPFLHYLKVLFLDVSPEIHFTWNSI